MMKTRLILAWLAITALALTGCDLGSRAPARRLPRSPLPCLRTTPRARRCVEVPSPPYVMRSHRHEDCHAFCAPHWP
jgi:hypothetical protein